MMELTVWFYLWGFRACMYEYGYGHGMKAAFFLYLYELAPRHWGHKCGADEHRGRK